MNNTPIYLHGENARDPKLIEISEDASIKDIINEYKKKFPGEGTPSEIDIFIEDEEDYKQKDNSCKEAGIKKRMHIHCHRYKKIDVIITYNGDDKSFHESPSATTKKIMKKAIYAFNISEADAGDYLLKLDDKTVLQPSDHIGSFVVYPRCQVKLYLTPTKPIQG